MSIVQTIKNTVRQLDKYSPWPMFYPFIMTPAERRLFKQQISQATCYLEFGLGGSTIKALQQSNAQVHSVESSQQWIDIMRGYRYLRRHENKRLFVHYVDIGPTVDWGFPKDPKDNAKFADYSGNIYQTLDIQTIDLAIVDGRFRVACALKLILEGVNNPNLKIMFHDFWNRKRYQIVLKYLDVIEKADTMGLFKIKSDVDLTAVAKDYQEYSVIPD